MTVAALNTVARWVLFPALYAAGVFPLLFASIIIGSLFERTFGCPACDFGGLLWLLVVGPLVFVPLSWLLIDQERPRPPGILDHLRHCVVLYAEVAVLGYVLATSFYTTRGGLEGALYIALSLVAAYAILLDASTAYVMRRPISTR